MSKSVKQSMNLMKEERTMTKRDECKELDVLKKIVCSCHPMEIYDGKIMMNDTFFTLEKDRDRYLYLDKLIKEREEEYQF